MYNQQYLWTTIHFPSFEGVVKDIVGLNWIRVTTLQDDFRQHFPGFSFSTIYNGNAFVITLPALMQCIDYVSYSIGTEIFLANESIQTVINYTGAVIGKGGNGLRHIEYRAPCKCVIYHDGGAFYVKFPNTTSVQNRLICMAFVKRAIYSRGLWLEERFT